MSKSFDIIAMDIRGQTHVMEGMNKCTLLCGDGLNIVYRLERLVGGRARVARTSVGVPGGRGWCSGGVLTG